MERFKKILLVFDPGLKTQAAVNQVVSLAKDNAARVTIVSVIKDLPAEKRMAIVAMPPQELFAQAKKERQSQLDALVAELSQQGVKASAKVLSGTPFLEIIRQVLRGKHDLVITTAEGKTGLGGRLFGSTSMHLMRKCPCPVWVVKPTRRKIHKRILAAVDTANDHPDPQQDSLNSLILQLSGSVAQRDNSELHVVQAWSVYGESYMSLRGGVSDKSINEMRKFAKRQYSSEVDKLLDDAGINRRDVVKHLPRSESVSKAIVSLANNKKIDLLVMGTVSRTGVAGLLIGNTAEKVLNKVNCSVLTVKPEGFVTPVTLSKG